MKWHSKCNGNEKIYKIIVSKSNKIIMNGMITKNIQFLSKYRFLFKSNVLARTKCFFDYASNENFAVTKIINGTYLDASIVNLFL